MKKEINAFDYANQIMSALPGGILLTTKSGDKVNSMTIGWGTLGIEWNKPIFCAYVREHRFTKELLDKNPEFTINVPLGDFNKKILGYCGRKSGRDCDKIKDLDLTLIDGDLVDVPAIKEIPLTLECKVIYSKKQDKNAISEYNNKTFYPQDVDSFNNGSNKDYHYVYYGEIVKAYIVE